MTATKETKKSDLLINRPPLCKLINYKLFSDFLQACGEVGKDGSQSPLFRQGASIRRTEKRSVEERLCQYRRGVTGRSPVWGVVENAEFKLPLAA